MQKIHTTTDMVNFVAFQTIGKHGKRGKTSTSCFILAGKSWMFSFETPRCRRILFETKCLLRDGKLAAMPREESFFFSRKKCTRHVMFCVNSVYFVLFL